MKRNLSWLLLGIVLVVGIAASVSISTSNLYIQNSDPAEVKIRVRTAATQTAPWLEFNNDGTLAFSIPATGIVPVAYGGTGAATAAAARASLGVVESSTNATPLVWRNYLELPESHTNTILPILAGGTAAATAATARTNLGTAVQWRNHLGLVEAQVTNTILPILAGGTSADSIAGALTAFGILVGQSTLSDDGTVTNDYGVMYFVPPRIVATGGSETITNVYVTSITESNCIFGGLTNDVVNWIAIGTPAG